MDCIIISHYPRTTLSSEFPFIKCPLAIINLLLCKPVCCVRTVENIYPKSDYLAKRTMNFSAQGLPVGTWLSGLAAPVCNQHTHVPTWFPKERLLLPQSYRLDKQAKYAYD